MCLLYLFIAVKYLWRTYYLLDMLGIKRNYTQGLGGGLEINWKIKE